MSILNISILKENVNILIKQKGLTQQQLADEIGMSQANLSKALNPNEKKCFTVEQLFSISQYFKVSLDELVGNKAIDDNITSPRFLFDLLSTLLRKRIIKTTNITTMETIYTPYFATPDLPDGKVSTNEVNNLAFYFPSYLNPVDECDTDQEIEEMISLFYFESNKSNYYHMNQILEKFIPVIDLYLKKQIKDDAFEIILKGYQTEFPVKKK